MLVERTVSSWQDGRWVSEGKKLSEFHSAPAYVLLGEPGIGKSTAFEEEAQNDEAAKEVTARRFISRSLDAHPEWRDAILFIDSLDEVRAGGGDLREPLDSLVCRLEKLGNPRFRLSCREDSWLGHGDFRELTSATIGEEVHLLRLDPLTEQDIHRILAAVGVPDPDDFCWQATNRGLGTFLHNPLLLDILVKANDSGWWLEGRMATFERACEALVRETNREHLDAQDGHPFPLDEVVLAAGRLCSILLLCGNSGWSRRGAGDDEFPTLSEVGEEQPLLQFALDTKLFEGDAETGRRPRHRQIAEFLAAGFLDHAIREHGLPAGRVLAWMRGIDGMVVPDLRGVSLWLAARNAEFRRPLIESDPVGIAFQGDTERFSLDETALLFRALETQLKHQHLTGQWERESSASLGSLMAGPGREILYGMLRAPDRSEFRLRFIERLLRGLGEATQRDARSGLSGSVERRDVAQVVLDTTIRDPSWPHDIRNRALIELVWVHENLSGSPLILLSLLRDLAEGKMPETETGSLGLHLLDYLYPQHLDAERFWDYVEKLWSAPPPAENSWDGNKSTWARRLVYRLSPSDVRILLETLVRKARTLNRVLVKNEAENFVERLLFRGLQLFGENMEPAELYAWFELVQAADHGLGLVLAHCQPRVSVSVIWPQGQCEIQLALILEGLKRNASQPRDRALDHEVGVKFLGGKVPPRFRRWCLEKAVALAETEPASAIELTHWTVVDRKAWGQPLNGEEIVTAVRDTPLLLEWHEQHVAEAIQSRQSRQGLQEREPREADASPARTVSAGLEAHQATPERLQELGQAYLSGFRSDGIRQARTGLGRLLGDDNSLQDSVICSLRDFATQSDLPSLDEIARYHGRGRCSPFSAPFLAGIIEEEAAGPYPLELPDNELLRRALGFYLLSGLHTRPHPIPITFRGQVMAHLKRPKHEPPGWYLRSLESNPETVADAFVVVTRARVRSKEPPDQHIFDLAWEPEYSRIGPLAVPRMLATFPRRCSRNQVLSLQAVLWAALNHMPSDNLRQLILRRLELKTMDPAQLATWLAAGLFVDRETCVPRVVEFLGKGTAKRCRHLLDFLVPNREPLLNMQWSTPDLGALIKAMGKKLSTPLDLADFALGWKFWPLLDLWAGTLVDRVDDESAATLAELVEDPALKNCRGDLLRARDRQSLKRRVAHYKAPTIPEIRNGLSGGPPSGPADLAALVTDKLTGLTNRIRNGNTDDWQQYWHMEPGDPKGRKVTLPKAENPCRDALLSDLQMLLGPHDVDAQPEGHHAEDARSDIIAVHGVHAVVVEIKKTDSRDLWSALEEQLIGKYARDPRSGGYGIFLVLWFGADNLRRPSPAGTRPSSPEELRNMLEESLTHEQCRTISVIVLDVSAAAGRVQSANMENTR